MAFHVPSVMDTKYPSASSMTWCSRTIQAAKATQVNKSACSQHWHLWQSTAHKIGNLSHTHKPSYWKACQQFYCSSSSLCSASGIHRPVCCQLLEYGTTKHYFRSRHLCVSFSCIPRATEWKSPTCGMSVLDHQPSSKHKHHSTIVIHSAETVGEQTRRTFESSFRDSSGYGGMAPPVSEVINLRIFIGPTVLLGLSPLLSTKLDCICELICDWLCACRCGEYSHLPCFRIFQDSNFIWRPESIALHIVVLMLAAVLNLALKVSASIIQERSFYFD